MYINIIMWVIIGVITAAIIILSRSNILRILIIVAAIAIFFFTFMYFKRAVKDTEVVNKMTNKIESMYEKSKLSDCKKVDENTIEYKEKKIKLKDLDEYLRVPAKVSGSIDEIEAGEKLSKLAAKYTSISILVAIYYVCLIIILSVTINMLIIKIKNTKKK